MSRGPLGCVPNRNACVHAGVSLETCDLSDSGHMQDKAMKARKEASKRLGVRQDPC
jgi:hypothetical protein